MNALFETTLQAVGLRKLAPTKLDLKLLTDGLGRTQPMGYATGTALASWLGSTGDALSASGYTNHGTAYSVVSYILKVAAPIPWAVYKLDKADNKAKPVPAHPLADLLYRPNPKQSWADLKTEAEGCDLLHGEIFLRGVRPPAGSRAGKVSEVWVLPPACVELLPLGGQLGMYDTPTGYRFTDPATGRWTDYPAEEILHLKRWNPANPQRGLSPVSASIDALTAAKAGLTNRVTQYQNQGPPGIVYDENQEPWAPEQARGVQAFFNSFKPGGRRQGNLPVLTGKLGYLKLGLSPVDLDVLAAIPHDKDAVADIWHFPGQLMNGSKGTTFSNMGEAGAALYSRCVIPEETYFRDGLNRWLGPDWDDEVYLDFDVSHIPELQPNKEKLAQWLATAWWVSVPEKQRMMGVTVDWKGEPFMVPAGLVPASAIGQAPTEEVV